MERKISNHFCTGGHSLVYSERSEESPIIPVREAKEEIGGDVSPTIAGST
jgi:hypothetical protein